ARSDRAGGSTVRRTSSGCRASVDLFYEPRTDPVLAAAGGCTVRTDKRLKAIAVKAGGQMARAYALSYLASTTTSRSLLSTVTLFGTASTVTAAGVVSGGISQVIGRFGYAA